MQRLFDVRVSKSVLEKKCVSIVEYRCACVSACFALSIVHFGTVLLYVSAGSVFQVF